MKYALIGCGRIAPHHIKAATLNGLGIAAVCDLDKEKAQALLRESGAPDGIAVYTDYRQMLEQVKPEIVAVATDSGSHAAIALDCIAAGCHVLIEKPIALSMRDARAIRDAAKEKGVTVANCLQNRFNTAVCATRAALQAGRFGKLSHGTVQVRWMRGADYYAQADWRGTFAKDGGALMNQSIHGIDLLRWMMGDEIEEVYGVTRRLLHDTIEAEDIGMAVLRFKNGAVGTVEGTTNVFPTDLEETLAIFGQTGTVRIAGTNTNLIDVWRFADRRPEDETDGKIAESGATVYGNGHTSLYADVLAAIRERRAPLCDAEAGIRALETVLAIYLSSKTHQPVRLPLADCATTDFSIEDVK